MVKITFVVAEITGCNHFFGGQDPFCSGLHTFKETVMSSSVAKIIFVVAEITFKVTVVTSSLAKITFVVAEITFTVAVITHQWS